MKRLMISTIKFYHKHSKLFHLITNGYPSFFEGKNNPVGNKQANKFKSSAKKGTENSQNNFKSHSYKY